MKSKSGWGEGIRTPECWYQKPEPYRLATPQKRVKFHGEHASPEHLSSEILSLLRLMQIEMAQWGIYQNMRLFYLDFDFCM